jgi:hypothetical protein
MTSPSAPTPIVTSAPTQNNTPAPAAAFGLQAAAQGKPDTRLRYEYAATPGGVVKDQVAVVNIGATPLSLDLYAADATTAADGSFALNAPGVKPTQVGAWLSLDSPGKVTVPARTSKGPSYKFVNFTLTVPKNATPGDHAGAIVVSLTAKADGGKVNENLVQRVGYRVYARVSGTLHPNLSIQKLSATYKGPFLANPFGHAGSLTVKYRVYNSGNVSLGARQTISEKPAVGNKQTVTSVMPASNAVKVAFPDIPSLLPGSFVDVTQVLHDVPPGYKIDVKVVLTPVVPDGQSDPNAGPFTASTSVWAMTWLPTSVVGVALLAAAGLWFWRRWLRKTTARARHGAKASKNAKPKKEKAAVGAQDSVESGGESE